MQKILVFSDPHVTVAPETIIGLDPAARLAEALDHAALAHGDAARAVICGDLVHNGRPEDYALLRRLLAADPGLTIYIVTAFEPDFIEDLRVARQDGLDFELLRKPIGIAELRTVVRGLLGADAAPSGSQESGG